MWQERLLQKDLVPDFLIRRTIRKLLAQRLDEIHQGSEKAWKAYLQNYISSLRQSPIALNTAEANEQHYEVPTEFYLHVLGPHLKYSSGYWPKESNTRKLYEGLAQSEKAMLEMTAERAELEDGQDVLELGCGWGSLTLYMARHYPNSQITAVSNSSTQKKYIDAKAHAEGLTNVRVITADMNDFELYEAFDRVVSVEMFEHMRNYELLLAKVARMLKENGKLFVHIFTHKDTPYLFEIKDDTDWMSKYFFTGGMMPSKNLFHEFQRDLKLEAQWMVEGGHYQKTCEAWLQKMDRAKEEVYPLLAETYGQDQATKWWVYWRVFLMACAELFGYNGGNEWFVSHYRFHKR